MKLFKLLLIIGFLSPSLGFGQIDPSNLSGLSGVSGTSDINDYIREYPSVNQILIDMNEFCKIDKKKLVGINSEDNELCKGLLARYRIEARNAKRDYLYSLGYDINRGSRDRDSDSGSTLAGNSFECDSFKSDKQRIKCIEEHTTIARITRNGNLYTDAFDFAANLADGYFSYESFLKGQNTKVDMAKISSQNSIATGNPYISPEMAQVAFKYGDDSYCLLYPNATGCLMRNIPSGMFSGTGMGYQGGMGMGYQQGGYNQYMMNPMSNLPGTINYFQNITGTGQNGYNGYNTGRYTGTANLNIIGG